MARKKGHLQRCPNCKSDETVKNGTTHGRQRFLCRVCRCSFSTSPEIGERTYYRQRTPIDEMVRALWAAYREAMEYQAFAIPIRPGHYEYVAGHKLKTLVRWANLVSTDRSYFAGIFEKLCGDDRNEMRLFFWPFVEQLAGDEDWQRYFPKERE